MMTENKLSY